MTEPAYSRPPVDAVVNAWSAPGSEGLGRGARRTQATSIGTTRSSESFQLDPAARILRS
jgi:GTP cyclohydrolase III